jgi:hypothetical protein
MSSVRVEPIARRALATPARTDATIARAALWTLFAGHLVSSWGTQWDIRWHLTIGRDSFWIAPHVMTYSGVTLLVLVSFGMLAWTTLGRASGPATLRIFGVSGSAGWHLAAWGIALTVLAAPIDDLWHRLFGLDVTLWSPPHLLGLLGGLVNAAACWLIADETHPSGRARWAAIVLAGAFVYGSCTLALQPSVRMAYVHGGVWFFTYPMLGALLAPWPLIVTARRSGLRIAPLLVLLVVLAVGIVGAEVSRLGFAWMQPTSFLAEEIARDPTSPIAVAHEIARKNGTPVRVGNPLLVALSALAALAMVAVDARRRPVPATLAWALTMFVVTGLMLARAPAFAASLPNPLEVAAALVLTALAALLAGRIVARATRA